MNKSVGPLLNELREGLRSLYATRLRGIYVFGSYARGEEDPESDLDVLIVLDDFERYGDEVRRAGGLAASLSLLHGLSISMVFQREREWLEADTPFLANVREEAVPA